MEHALVDIAGLELRAFEEGRARGSDRCVRILSRAGAKKEAVRSRRLLAGSRARVRAWDAKRTVTSTWYPTSTSATNARRSRPGTRPAGGMVSRLRASGSRLRNLSHAVNGAQALLQPRGEGVTVSRGCADRSVGTTACVPRLFTKPPLPPCAHLAHVGLAELSASRASPIHPPARLHAEADSLNFRTRMGIQSESANAMKSTPLRTSSLKNNYLKKNSPPALTVSTRA